MNETFKCWDSKEDGCDIEYCESMGNKQPCKYINKCPVYKYNKDLMLSFCPQRRINIKL